MRLMAQVLGQLYTQGRLEALADGPDEKLWPK
jgi:hypothetical protein